MRLVITGARGQVGTQLVDLARERGHHVVGLAHGGSGGLELTDPGSVRAAIEAASPEVIVHAAAWTDVDGCELDEDRAMAVNAEGTGHVVAAARAAGARVVLVSTDYVFGGHAPDHDETATVDPRSAYGRSKVAGEQALGGEDAIVRTSWVCGRHGPNAVRTVLRLAQRGAPLRFVDDQIGRPTFVDDLAPALLHVAEAGLSGTIHASNATTLSWHGFARAIVEAAGLDPDVVEPIATGDLDPPRPATRPARSVLVGTALDRSGHGSLPPMDASLARLVDAILRERPEP